MVEQDKVSALEAAGLADVKAGSAPLAAAEPSPLQGLSRIPEFPAELDARQMEIYNRIAAGPRGRVRGPLAMMLYSPDLAEHAQALGEFARYKSCFPPHLSELVILIVAQHFDCAYEWAIHAPIAEKAGVPAEAIAALRVGGRPVFADPEQSVLFAFVEQLLATNRTNDEIFGKFRQVFGEQGIIEVTAIMGYYTLVGFMLNAVRPMSDDKRGTGTPGLPGTGPDLR